jgi:cobaltochelatase CobT
MLSKLLNLFRALFGKPLPVIVTKTEGYRVYTTAFDREVQASELDAVLGPLSTEDARTLEEAWKVFQQGLQAWRTKAHIDALGASTDVRAQLSEDWLQKCAFTLLIDQSGSMRGQSMLLAAAAADIAHDFLRHLGCSVEILGFTTTSWQGGQSRRKWLSKTRIASPGRLCDVLHVIYGSSHDPAGGTGSWSLRPMLRPDLPKENIDGEALAWAAQRMQKMPYPHKFLIVISDGAPVDDSTLTENSADYLERHLLSVIEGIEEGGAINLAAIGIGHDVTRYYRNGHTVRTPEDLGSALIEKIKALLLSNKTD